MAILVCCFLGVSALIPSAHAGGLPTFDFAGTAISLGAGGSTGPVTQSNTVKAGELLTIEMVTIENTGTCSTVTVTDSQTNAFSTLGCQSVAVSGGTASEQWTQQIVTGFAKTAGSDTFTFSWAGTIELFAQILGYVNVNTVTGFNQNTVNPSCSGTCGGTATLNVLTSPGTGDLLGTAFVQMPNNVYSISPVGTCRGNPACPSFGGIAASADPGIGDILSGAIAPNTKVLWNWNCNAGPCAYSIMAWDMSAGFTGDTTTVTNCFGNCGNPAVTLSNVNSTRSVNWNQSVTLLYIVQAALTGFLNNVTVNLAHNLTVVGQAPVLGFYLSNCPAGQQAFSSQCPGLEQIGGTTNAFFKGRASLTGGPQYRIQAGQWMGIALSAQFAPMDVNGTNTFNSIYQTSGTVPQTIASVALFDPSSKIGLWAWVTGSTVTNPTPTTGNVCDNNFAQIDCLLPALTNTFCQAVTSACQTESALIWIPILALLFVAVVFGVFHSLFPTLEIGFQHLGEIFIVMMLVFVLVFSQAGLLPLYVPLFIFFVTAIILGKRVEGYF